jgi:uncharacterized OB-fold protein
MTRPAPKLTERTRPYWLSGREGVLSIATCLACGWRTHPPMPVCPRCHSFDIAFRPVSGEGRVHAWALNRYAWAPGLAPPYIVADVELVEQPGLIVLTSIVDCPPDAVRNGMAVRVAFEQVGELFVPVFRP